jgi:hypothetical protein
VPPCKDLVHAVLGVPGALLFADVNNLADVVGVVGADVREDLGGFFQLGFVGGLHPFFEFAHDFVKLLYGFIPSLAVKFVEGFVIIAAELFDFFSLEVGEITPIPKHQVVGQLANGVISFAVGPVGLLGGQAFDGGIGGHEPFGVGVRGTQFDEQHPHEDWWGSCLGLEWMLERAQEQEQPKARPEESTFA